MGSSGGGVAGALLEFSSRCPARRRRWSDAPSRPRRTDCPCYRALRRRPGGPGQTKLYSGTQCTVCPLLVRAQPTRTASRHRLPRRWPVRTPPASTTAPGCRPRPSKRGRMQPCPTAPAASIGPDRVGTADVLRNEINALNGGRSGACFPLPDRAYSGTARCGTRVMTEGGSAIVQLPRRSSGAVHIRHPW